MSKKKEQRNLPHSHGSDLRICYCANFEPTAQQRADYERAEMKIRMFGHDEASRNGAASMVYTKRKAAKRDVAGELADAETLAFPTNWRRK